MLHLQLMAQQRSSHKNTATSHFAKKEYHEAISEYNEAIAVCPDYLDYELAVLRSNIAACYLKLKEWKEAVSAATTALDLLDKLEAKEKEKEKEDEMVEDEIVSEGALAAGPALDTRKKLQDDIAKIRQKTLFRRAAARASLGGWANREGAIEDYKRLEAMDADLGLLGPAEKKMVQAQLRILPGLAKADQEKETAEALSKLKDLGNMLLKPLGISTDNFKMVKDEKTGGYSMSFEGGNKGTN